MQGEFLKKKRTWKYKNLRIFVRFLYNKYYLKNVGSDMNDYFCVNIVIDSGDRYAEIGDSSYFNLLKSTVVWFFRKNNTAFGVLNVLVSPLQPYLLNYFLSKITQFSLNLISSRIMQ